MISSARTGTSQVDFNRRRSGVVNPAPDLISGAEMAGAELSLSSVGLASATFSKLFSAEGVVAPLSAGSADARRRPSAEPMSKQIFWSRLKKRSTDRDARFRCAAPALTRSKIIRSKFRAGFMKGSAFVSPVRERPARAEEKVVIFFCGYVSRNIQTSQSKAAISFTKRRSRRGKRLWERN